MKKYILLILTLALTVVNAVAQGYDPVNPADPNAPDTTSYFALNVSVTPKMGGSVSKIPNYPTVKVGTRTTINATAAAGYVFLGWIEDDSIVSTSQSYSFTMPYRDVTLNAVFEFNPASAADPEIAPITHRVLLKVTPKDAGTTNPESLFSLKEGESRHIYAYNNAGYSFKHWMRDGMIVSAKNPMKVTMADKEQEYTAVFVYDPVNPASPNENLFNPVNGEMLIDFFAPGYLRSRMNEELGKSTFADIETLTIKGEMNTGDWGFASGLKNVTEIDLSRVTGYTKMNGYSFNDCVAMISIKLPACLEKVEYNAFRGCGMLSELTCLALVPPTATSDSFYGLPEDVVLKVPSQSLHLYRVAPGWKDFFLKESDDTNYTITVNFPEERPASLFNGSQLNLYNKLTAQTTTLLVSEKDSVFVFKNIQRGVEYDVFLTDVNKRELSRLAELVVVDTSIDTTLTSLPLPATICSSLLDERNNEYADENTVRWYDGKGNLIGIGAELHSAYVGDTVRREYIYPSYLEGYAEPVADTLIAVTDIMHSESLTLNRYDRYLLNVVVMTTDSMLLEAEVLMSQYVSPTYTDVSMSQTTAEWAAAFTVFDRPLRLTATSKGFNMKTVDVTNIHELIDFGYKPLVGDAQLNVAGRANVIIVLDSIHYDYNQTISYQIGYQRSTYPDDEAAVDYSLVDYTDVELRLIDGDGNAVEDAVVGAGVFYLKDSVDRYMPLWLEVASRADRFDTVTAPVEIKQSARVEGIGTIALYKEYYANATIVERGSLVAVTTDVPDNMAAMLYGPDGQLVARQFYETNWSYDGMEVAEFKNLKEGTYTLITMMYNPLYCSMQSLDDFLALGFEEEKDFDIMTATISDGMISVVRVEFHWEEDTPEPPVIEMPTVDTETYFMVNKTSTTVGNTLTARAKLTMKSNWHDLIDHINIIITLPEGVDFVENSIVSLRDVSDYQIDGRRVIIPMGDVHSDVVRFCVMPTQGGDFTMSATMQYMFNGVSTIAPIGSAIFTAEDITIATPMTTNVPTIGVTGVGPADSRIDIYDNNRKVGTTYSNPGGDWHLEIDLHKPYHYSRHEVRAEVDYNGHILKTPTLTVDYSDDTPTVDHINMIYRGETYKFDNRRALVSQKFYSYWQEDKDFTFVVNFTDNDSSRITNVVFKVLNSDGTLSEYNGRWQPTTRNWATTMEYASASKLPVNVKVEYMVVPRRSDDHAQPLTDQAALLHNAHQAVRRYVYDNTIINSYEDRKGTLSFAGKEMDFTIGYVDYDSIAALATTNRFDYRFTTDGNLLFAHADNSAAAVTVYWLDQNSKKAYRLSLSETAKAKKAVVHPGDIEEIPNVSMPTIPSSVSGGWFTKPTGFAANFNAAYIAAFDALLDRGDFAQRVDDANYLSDMLNNWSEILRRQVYSRWENNLYCLPDGEIQAFARERHDLMVRDSVFQERYRDYIRAYREAMYGQIMQTIAATISARISNVTWPETLYADAGAVQDVLANSLARLADDAMGLQSTPLDPTKSRANASTNNVWKWSYDALKDIHQDYHDLGYRLSQRVWSIQKWGYVPYESFGTWGWWRFATRRITPIIDPSGYVYEAVEGNRLQGVRAMVYYRETTEDEFGDKHESAKIWNAEEYGQENPLYTDEQGMYSWDVPAGMWQVKFEKEGYETTYSEWLPVPPPQLEVNVGMKQNKRPEVIDAKAYADAITVEFDKYIKTTTLIPEFIVVAQAGDTLTTKVKLLDAAEGKGETLARKIEIVPTKALAEGEVTLRISQYVTAYSGLNLGIDYVKTFTIEPRITAIVTDSVVRVPVGEAVTVDAAVLTIEAAQGKSISVASASAAIAAVSESESLVPDEKGELSFTVEGIMLGRTTVTLSVDGYDATGSFAVNVVNRADYTTDAPQASKASGMVMRGTQVTLSCTDERATIYYTTDGTSPVDNALALIYDGTPITISEEMTLRIVAKNVADDLYYSDERSYSYTIDPLSGISDAAATAVKVTPTIVTDRLHIDLGSAVARHIAIVDAAGVVRYTISDVSHALIVSADVLGSGVHMVTITLADGRTMRTKIVVK